MIERSFYFVVESSSKLPLLGGVMRNESSRFLTYGAAHMAGTNSAEINRGAGRPCTVRVLSSPRVAEINE